MNIVVDIRCLMDRQRTGVGEYTYGLLSSLFEVDKENNYFLFFNSHKDVSGNIPMWQQENAHYIYTRWPNKLLNLLVWLKFIKLDYLVIKNCPDFVEDARLNRHLKIKNFKLKIDVWFSPNLNFTHLSEHIKRILTIHDLSFEFFPECFTFKQRLWHWFLNPRGQCQKADKILTPSENTKRDVAAQFQVPSSKFQVLRPGLSWNEERGMGNGEQARQKYNLPGKFILYLGTLEPRKNVEALIEAYKMNYELGIRDYDLVIAGSRGWKNKKLLKMIARTPGVKYIGYVLEEDKPALYESASLFVFPSLYEGFGLPVLEAMASGAPVITSNRSSLPEVAGGAGHLVNPRNVSEIAEAMKKILSDEKLRCILSESGKGKRESFAWNKSATDLKNIFQEIAG